MLETLVRTNRICSRLFQVYDLLSGEEKKKESLQKRTKILKYKKPLKELISEKKTKKISEKKVRVFIITNLIKQNSINLYNLYQDLLRIKVLNRQISIIKLRKNF